MMIYACASEAAPYAVFGTKAETLQGLRARVHRSKVAPLVYFTRVQWHSERTGMLGAIARRFSGQAVAVRSSAQAEDGRCSSNAGAYLSELDTPVVDRAALAAAVDRVFASMPNDPQDQVLVQAMIGPVSISGVLLTFDLVHGAPYYVINYDDETGRTDSVTSGANSKSVLVYRGAAADTIRSPRISRLLAMARELEGLFDGAPLDIEFALGVTGVLHLLQVRRIAVASRWHPVTERRVARQLIFVENFVRECAAPQAGILGARSILGVMPDWNPAEIIGTTPRPLAVSLYRQLVTRSVWRESRAFMGYRRLPPQELMVVINGHPYIDVRASFNSFLPAGLDDATGGRLVDHWLDRLEAAPELHDKVEFAVAQTCTDFLLAREVRTSGALTTAQSRRFIDASRDLTASCVDLRSTGSLGQALALTAELEQAQTRRRLASGTAGAQLRQAISLVADCRRAGTFPFAVVARHAFIAEALLRSAVVRGAITGDRLDVFRSTLRTVTSDLLVEFDAVVRGRVAPSRFLARFGHLRPGTYDITSLRYDERDDLFASLPVAAIRSAEVATFVLRPGERRAIDLLLKEARLDGLTARGLFDYARRAITGREHAKFVFTRDLSDALLMLVGWGEAQGLSREDLSLLDWPSIEAVLNAPVIDHTDRHFLEIAERGRRASAYAHAFRLPHLIRSPRDVYVATQHRSEPNFIGAAEVYAPVQRIDATTRVGDVAAGVIAFVEHADPGFDWIFTRGIRGLVTRFGGANSHMAIRCAELSLPAAIGCGEPLYGRLAASAAVELNCAQRILRACDV